MLLMGRALRQDGRGSATDLRLAARVIEDAGGAFRPSAAEQAMGVMGSGKPQPLNTGASTTFLAPTNAGSRSVYKPSPLECIPSRGIGLLDMPFRRGIPRGHGQLAARDVGAFRLDEALGFGRVPPTGLLDGPFGRGSNQQWVFSAPSYPSLEWGRLSRREAAAKSRGQISPSATGYLPLNSHERFALALRELQRYPPIQREQMAVLDYVMGNTDRHWGNFRTDRHGGIVAIDNTLSFPEVPDPIFGIRSDFVTEFRGVVLSPEVVDRVRAVDPEMLRASWTDAGLGDKAITGALQRLQEIRDDGMITGRAWPGTINGAVVDLGTAPLPTGWIAT